MDRQVSEQRGITPGKAVYIETYGCQMNKLDSENVRAILEEDGFAVVTDIGLADVILLNTCGVREHAEERVRGRINELHALRTVNPDLFFGVIGCMAQRLGDRLLTGDVRIVAGPDSYRRLPYLVRCACAGRAVDTGLDTSETYQDIRTLRLSTCSAWIAVTRGCDNYCSYCIVPYVRGRERSIPAGSIVAEARRLADSGWREITLLGQNVNSYRDGTVDFAGLLRRVSETGIPWIRFLTSHPKDLTRDIVRVMAERDNVCPHLHLPLQSGSDRILAAMNRKYTVGSYLRLIDMVREMVDGVSITTDLLFGFPGESDEDFRETLGIMETVRFDFAFLYRYSERAGTKACTLAGSVPEQTRIERLKKAIALQTSINYQKNRERIGSRAVVLVTGPSKDGRGWFGFSETGFPVVVYAGSGNIAAGSFLKVRIESTTGASLVGAVV